MEYKTDAEVYTSKKKQNIHLPCFRVKSIKTGHKRTLGKRYDKPMSFSITYLPKTDDEDELRTVESELPFVLESINVDGNLVRGTDISCVISDGALVCTIDYNMRLVVQDEKEEKMNELYAKGKVK